MTAELKKWRRIFTALASIWSNIFTNSNEKTDLFITLSIAYFQILNSYLLEFLNILLYVETNPVWMCLKCLYSAVIFTSKLDYFRRHFVCFSFARRPRKKMRPRVTRDGTISPKKSTFGYFDGTNPITGKGIQLRSPIMAPGSVA